MSARSMLLSSCQSALLLLASICLLWMMLYFGICNIAAAAIIAISRSSALIMVLKAACRTGPVRKLKHWFGA